MKDRTFLQKRKNGYYYFRKRLSPEIQAIIGKTEIIKSLNTSDKNEAIKLSTKFEARFYEFLNHTKNGSQAVIGNINVSNQIGYSVQKLLEEEKTKVYTLKDLLEKWVQQNKPAYSSISEWTLTVKQFNEAFGIIPIESITTKHITNFKEIISAVPARYSLKYTNSDIVSIYKKFKDKTDYTRTSKSTITKKLGAIKSLLSFALNEGIISFNPAVGVKIKGSKPILRIQLRHFRVLCDLSCNGA